MLIALRLALFSTLTNVNFDSDRIVGYAKEAIYFRESLKSRTVAKNAAIQVTNPRAEIQLAGNDLDSLQKQAQLFALNGDKAQIGDDLHGLRMLCLYGFKRGCCLYGACACFRSIR